jgi:hypothetical protein
MLKLTFNNGYRMAIAQCKENRGRLRLSGTGKAGPGAVRGLWLEGPGPLPLDGDERPREFNRMEFSVMCNGCNGRTANKTGHHKSFGAGSSFAGGAGPLPPLTARRAAVSILTVLVTRANCR